MCALAALPSLAGAQPAPVVVTVNGQPVTFDQPPVEVAGRVFVPLRGVFERLGASVVYDRRRINATKDATTVSLTVGSTSALVNGKQQFLDNPAFIVGARVLVPLRFVSQALGTTVDFVRATRTVAITIPGRSRPRRALATLGAGGLMDLAPADNATAPQHLARITAAFTAPVDPKTVHAHLDGTDITSSVYVTGRTFVYYVVDPLAHGSHTVTINGRTTDGKPLDTHWSFTVAG